MDKQKIVEQIIELLGGVENIVSITNCMTRLRAVVKNEDGINEEKLKNTEMVLGVVHDRACAYEIVVGPGNSRQLADICHEMGIPAVAETDINDTTSKDDWKANKDAIKASQKDNKVKDFLKMIGDIFVPLIPGIIAAGLCAGFASLITQLVPGYKDSKGWYIVYLLLTMINVSFMTYITAWAGYRAAERFGATAILGGMLGMITSLSQIDTLSKVLGLFNEADPLRSILRTGKGGVLAVVVGVLILAAVEKRIRKKMPASLDIVLTPLLTLIICVIPYVLVIMPIFGYVSNGIVWIFSKICMSENAIVRIIAGYASAALFLPMVAAGMHHGMVALYSVQLQELGYVTLYPALAMAGAGQVGASLALLGKAKTVKHTKLCSVIKGALPAGFLGVGEPLIYGVTLPMGRPFLTAGLGAGFGGAFVIFTQVASTTWGPSGLVGTFVMTAGKGGPIKSMLHYLIGLGIAYVASYIITKMLITDNEVEQALGGIPKENKNVFDNVKESSCSVISKNNCNTKEPKLMHNKKIVVHGEMIPFGSISEFKFEHIIKDPLGIHARPASELGKIISKYDCEVTIKKGNKNACAKSIIELMALGAEHGSKLEICVSGIDAKKAVESIKKFMDEKL